MRFIHTADIHLGAEPDLGKPWCKERSREIWRTFERIIEYTEQVRADLLLIAGDLFHRQPLVSELKEVNYLFSTLSKTQVVLIMGNHDCLKRGSNYFNFVWADNVSCLMGSEMQKVSFPHIKTDVYGLSYHTREIRESLYDQVTPQEQNRINILLAHGGDEKHIPIRKQALQQAGFDYIALGHLHKPAIIAEHQIAYAGAPEPLDINDTGVHGFMEGEITGSKRKIKFLALASREYIHKEICMDGNMTAAAVKDKIQEAVRHSGTEHIYKIILSGYRDPDVELDLERLESIGNITEVWDRTLPEYDFEKLAVTYEGHLIGRYINCFKASQPDTVERQALYAGLKALLEAKR